VRATEKAKKQAQKEKNIAQTKAQRALPVRTKPLAKPKKALVLKKKVM
jgi:hypothetical protein